MRLEQLSVLLITSLFPLKLLSITDTLKISSPVLNESRTVIIISNDTIIQPVDMVYLVDGEMYSEMLHEIILGDSSCSIIGVAILNTDRRRDLLAINEANNFLAFIERELIPLIEQNNNVKSRTLFGHSFGGAFVLFAMLNKPGLFDNYLAASPTPIMNMVEPYLFSDLDGVINKNINFYFNCGSYDMKQVNRWTNILNSNLKALELKKLKWKFEMLENADHNATSRPILINILNIQN